MHGHCSLNASGLKAERAYCITFIVQQMYEAAVPFFELAAQVQPQQVKWHLMVASCFRRTGNQQQVSSASLHS